MNNYGIIKETRKREAEITAADIQVQLREQNPYIIGTKAWREVAAIEMLERTKEGRKGTDTRKLTSLVEDYLAREEQERERKAILKAILVEDYLAREEQERERKAILVEIIWPGKNKREKEKLD